MTGACSQNTLAVEQWAAEFRKWTNIADHQVAMFTADHKEFFPGNVGILVSAEGTAGRWWGRRCVTGGCLSSRVDVGVARWRADRV